MSNQPTQKDQLGTGMTKPANRPKRIKLGAKNVLSFRTIPGYATRVVNDIEDRIERFKAAGWEMVQSDELLGEASIGETSRIGSAVSKSVRGGITGVLMKLPQDLYNEDQADKQADIDKAEEALYVEANKLGLTKNLKAQELAGIRITR